MSLNQSVDPPIRFAVVCEDVLIVALATWLAHCDFDAGSRFEPERIRPIDPIPTMKSGHFGPLDGLRGLAILGVILTHAYNEGGTGLIARAMNSFARSGWVGVTLFFVLSGFLITGILLDSRSGRNWYRNFVMRRSLRIFPLYFGFLAAYWFLIPHWKWAAEYLRIPTGQAALGFWLYLNNMQEIIAGVPAASFPALEHLWSLAVEEQVYLIWPLIIGLSHWRTLPRLLIAIGVASLAWKFGAALLREPVSVRYAWSFACLDAFAAGGLVAWASRDPVWAPHLPRLARQGAMGTALLLLGLAIGQGFHFNFWSNPLPMLTIGTAGTALFFASLIGLTLTTLDDHPLNRALSVTWLRWCGRYSYAAYLVHMMIIELLWAALGRSTPASRAATTLSAALGFTLAVSVLSFGAAWLSWHLWERHFLALKRFFPSPSRVVRPMETIINSRIDP